MPRSTLYHWKKSRIFNEELERSKRKQFQDNLRQINTLIPKAVEGLKELSESTNEQVRLRACVEILRVTDAHNKCAPPPYISIGDIRHGVSTEQLRILLNKILERFLSGELDASAAHQFFQILEKFMLHNIRIMCHEQGEDYAEIMESLSKISLKRAKDITSTYNEYSRNRH